MAKAKIVSYGSMRTYPAEYISTSLSDLALDELVSVSNGAVVRPTTEAPNYIVIGKTVNGKVPVAAILEDMVLESDSAITGYTKIGTKTYRKDTMYAAEK